MGEWKEYQLEELIDIGSSKRIFYKEYVPTGIPFYRSKEIIEKHNGKEISTDLFISKDKYDEIEVKYGVPVEGDLLLTSVGTLGVPYLVAPDEHFYFKDGNLTWFREFDERLLNTYLYYWIISPIGSYALDMVSIGSTQPALTIKGLKSIVINLPPFPEQKAIASTLSSLDDKIDLLHRQNKTLEGMAEALFRRCIEAESDEWEIVTLEEVSVRITDGAHKSPPTVEIGLPMASVKDMTNWDIDKESCRHISQEDFDELTKADCRPLENDILIAKDGSYLKHVFMCEQTMDVVILSSIAIIRPNFKYHPMLLSIFLKLNSTRERMENIVSGAVIPRIVLKDFRKFEIALPPQDTQNDLINLISPLFHKCWNNNRKICTLEKLRNTLLPKLMTGEVKVQHV